jgi:type I restriction enzyme S subunit
MSFTPYPKYKASGVEWLGDVPEGWVTQRLKHSSRIPIRNGLGESAESDDPTQPRYVRITDIKSPRELHESTFKSLPKETADLARFHVGDILFACVGATFGKSYLHSFDAGPMCFAGYLARYSPKPLMDSRFISYWTESRTYWDQLQANVIQSTIQNFSAAKYRELVLVIPPVPEQTAIAEFLDRETGKIDELVAEQRRLIELLKEKRQAVISHAVTKGLTPHAPMKPSGIEWLGDVPDGWSIVKLGNISRFKGGAGFPDAYQGQTDNEIPFFKVGDMVNADDARVMRQANHTITEATAKELRAFIFPANTIVFAKVGAALLLKRYRLLGQSSCIDNNMMGMTVGKGSLVDYLLYVLPLLDLELIVNPGAVPSMNEGQISGQRIALPPIDEQREIIAFLNLETAKFDTLTAEAQRAIDLLQERRNALISAAVTGQIDVLQQKTP